MMHEEASIQSDIVKSLSLLGVFLFAVPNDALGAASMARAGRYKAMGLMAGISDLILMGDDGRAHFLEIKTIEGRLSESQSRFKALCLSRGWNYGIARSVAEATYLAGLWGLIPPPAGGTILP